MFRLKSQFITDYFIYVTFVWVCWFLTEGRAHLQGVSCVPNQCSSHALSVVVRLFSFLLVQVPFLAMRLRSVPWCGSKDEKGISCVHVKGFTEYTIRFVASTTRMPAPNLVTVESSIIIILWQVLFCFILFFQWYISYFGVLFHIFYRDSQGKAKHFPCPFETTEFTQASKKKHFQVSDKLRIFLNRMMKSTNCPTSPLNNWFSHFCKCCYNIQR